MASNITKAFKAKAKLASGGVVTSLALGNKLQEEMNKTGDNGVPINRAMDLNDGLRGAQYTFGLESKDGRGGQYAFEPGPEPVQTNGPYKVGTAADPMSTASFGLGRAGNVSRPAQPTQPAADTRRPIPKITMGLADGGVVKPVKGKGTGTSDDVPVVLAGHDVDVSNGEGVAVLPAKTMRTPGAVEHIERVIEETNGKPVNKGLRDGGGYEQGLLEQVGNYLQPAADTSEAILHAGNTLVQGATVPFARIADAGLNAVAGMTGHTRPNDTALSDAAVERTMRSADKVSSGFKNSSVYKPLADAGNAVAKSAGFVPATGQDAPAAAKPSAPTAPAATTAPAAPTSSDLNNELQNRSIASQALVNHAQNQIGMKDTNAQLNAQLGLRAIASDPNVRGTLNAAHEIQGDNIQYGTTTGSDGRPQTMITGGPSTKPQYIGADGKATNNWYDTQAYKDGVARAEKDKETLRTMQRDNAMRDMGSDIRDPRAVATAGLRLAQMNTEGKNAAELAKSQLDATKWGIERKDKLSQDARDFKFKDDEAHKKQLNEFIAREAGDPKDPEYNNRVAALVKYSGQFKRGEGESADTHLRNLMDNYAVDKLFETEGRHLFDSEGPSNGEAVLPREEKVGWLKALSQGKLGSQDTLVDPATGRRIYISSDVLEKMSPAQREIIEKRKAEYLRKQVEGSLKAGQK